MSSIDTIAAELTRISLPNAEVRSHFMLPPSPLDLQPLPDRFPPWLTDTACAHGVTRLSNGQKHALDLLFQGQNVVFSAPSGSGRGLLRLLAMFQSLSPAQAGHALFVFAHKQHEHRQFQQFLTWNDGLDPEHQLAVAIYDGDTPTTQRRAMRQHLPQVVLTTPEMLHAGILAYHSGWRALFQHLHYVVIPDVHLCAGALLSHLCHLIRRLQRLAVHYGSKPQMLLTAAPLIYAESVSRPLTGQTCHVVNGEPWRPSPQHRVVIHATQDVISTALALLDPLQNARLPTVVLANQPMALSDKPPPENHQEAEFRLLCGEETTLVMPANTAVNAIHPHAYESLICVGIPESVTHLHSWLDGLGNRPTPSLGILVLNGSTSLERLFLRFPDLLQVSGAAHFPISLHNPYLLRHHLLCAASELSLQASETYAGIHQLERFLRWMVSQQALMQRLPSRQWIATEQRPHRRLNLRWFERPVTLINRQDSRRLARLDAVRAFRDCMPGGTYPHDDGGLFHVEYVDAERHRIVLQPTQETGLTQGRFHSTVAKKRLAAAVINNTYRMNFGALDYTETLESVERFDARTHVRQNVHMHAGTHQRQIRTQAAWLQFPPRSADWHRRSQPALHMLMHAVLAVLPLFLQTQPHAYRGGLYKFDDVEPGPLQAMVVDSHAGGNGVAAGVFQTAVPILSAALALLQQCECEQGCNRCAAESCETCNSSQPPSRAAGIALLQQMLGRTITTFDHLNPAADRRTRVGPRYIYLGVTTQKASDDVGGWQHKHLLGLALAMTYDVVEDRYCIYTEETVDQLIDQLHHADGIIGFNTRDFDYQVLQAYTERPLPSLPTCTMLEDVQQALGYRLSLRHLVYETLGIDRPDDSLQTVTWYREGHTERLIELCRRDINLIRDLVRHGAVAGILQYSDRTGTKGSIPVHWTFSETHG
jgi:DEAD/DEAH box helicase domain-containing protein